MASRWRRTRLDLSRTAASTTSFGTASLLSPALADMQGAALYQFDDAQFRPDDYESIQRVGDGTKLGDPTKTGQFGLGFNSVYHVTDTPMFVSGRDFVVFDPHEAHLPDGLPGLCEDASSLSRACPDQLAPFQGIFGCDVDAGCWRTRSGQGTLFRLPLRTREAAGRSRIKDGRGGAPSFEDHLEAESSLLWQVGDNDAAERAVQVKTVKLLDSSINYTV